MEARSLAATNPGFGTGGRPSHVLTKFLLCLILLIAPQKRCIHADQPLPFEEISNAAGIHHRHYKPILDQKLNNINAWVSSVGAAAAIGDFNRDGYMDIFATNSRKGEANFLYKNNGNGTFTDVAERAGVAHLNNENGVGMDAIWGDIDNDGLADLYIVRWGRDLLFRNNGDETFTDITEKVFRRRDGTPGTDWANGNAALFLDFNQDGRLDIYVGNYFKEDDLWHLEDTHIMHDDFEKSRNGGANFFYRQESDGTFTEISQQLGTDDTGWTLSVGAGDLNNDGWTDLYCANDFGPDQIFLNDHGQFANVTEAVIGTDTKKGMNVDFGDFNQDGWLDIYVANITTSEYLQEGNMLWLNNGPGTDGTLSMTDISLETGTYDGGWGWGAKFFDFDLDGDLDIIAVNGFISAGKESYWFDLASWTVMDDDVTDARNWPAIYNKSFSGYETTRVWRNNGYLLFQEESKTLGLDHDGDGRGVVSFDYDNDGDLDLYVANQDQKPNLFRNHLNASDHRHWLMLKLIGNPRLKTTKDALGARVTVTTPEGRQIRERDGGNSFSGQSDPRLHFGLGSCEEIPTIEIRWPDGGLQRLTRVKSNQLVTVYQDASAYMQSNQAPTMALIPKSKSVSTEQPNDISSALDAYETSMKQGIEDYTTTSRYRYLCRENNLHDRSVEFFQEIIKQDPEHLRARIELACAYVDKIPTCGGMASIVCKGTQARRSLDQLDHVINKQADSWLGYYTRGMNHLHWPRALRHSDDAAEDFEKCIQLQADLPPESYYSRVYLALGDAYAKAKQFKKARASWKEGQKRFPEERGFALRLSKTDDNRLFEWVDSFRSIESAIDTDLSFMDQPSH